MAVSFLPLPPGCLDVIAASPPAISNCSSAQRSWAASATLPHPAHARRQPLLAPAPTGQQAQWQNAASRGGAYALGAGPWERFWRPVSLLRGLQPDRGRRKGVRPHSRGPGSSREAEQAVLGDSTVESGGPERGGGEQEGATPGSEGQCKEAAPPWARPSAAEVVRAFRLEHATEAGCLVIQPLDKGQQEVTVELLAMCFADSIDAASFLAYIRTQIVKYLAEQQRFFAKGQGVCLVALWYPAPAPDGSPAAEPVVVGTVSLAFAVRSLPRFPTLNVPPERGSAYLSNMAVQPSHRRRGVARQLLQASEELAAAVGKRALYLHVRLIDDIPQMVYAAAGYAVVAQDTILSWLFLQRRRSLMKKQLKPAVTGELASLIRPRENAVS